MSSSAKYSPVDEKDEGFSDDRLDHQRSVPQTRLWLTHAGILALYTILFAVLYTTTHHRNNTSQCVSLLSTYSPALEAVEYQNIRYNGHLTLASQYRGPPSAAIDAAWDRISENNTLRPIRISDDELNKIYKGGRPSNVRFNADSGGGSLGSIEVFHQLHCLNMLRKVTYKGHYPEVKNLEHNRPEFFRDHLDHCIEIIRQNLMCAGDVGVITYDWIKGWERPFPDLNTYHQCRSFDRILEWSYNHQVHIAADQMKRLGDEVDLVEPPL